MRLEAPLRTARLMRSAAAPDVLKLDRLRIRGPHGAKDEFLLAATAQNLRKLAKLIPTPTHPVPA
jgi:hypothetical protein